jgi:hypothetical protein
MTPTAAGVSNAAVASRQVRLTLVPDSPTISAELHKLNIMTEGGFFKAHKVGLGVGLGGGE